MNSNIDNLKSNFEIERKANESNIQRYKKDITEYEEKLHRATEELEIYKVNQTQSSNDEIAKLTKLLELKETKIIETMDQNDTLKKENLNLSEKLNVLLLEKDKYIINKEYAEKNYKEDILAFRKKIEEKDTLIQNINYENENLKFEIEKLKVELKNLETTKSNDEAFFAQISNMQNLYSDRDKKAVSDLENEIKTLKKEIDTLNSQIKKNSMNYESEMNKIKSENIMFKQEIINLTDDSVGAKDNKEKIIKLEKTVSELQNNIALKKVELTQSQQEYDRKKDENTKLSQSIVELNLKIDSLERELIVTKQKLGDVLNEMSEMENAVILKSPDSKDKKKGIFLKKK